MSFEERAHLIAGTWRETVALARQDPRLFAWPMVCTHAARRRFRQWGEAGRPHADRESLAYAGDVLIERVVRSVVERLPEPVAWHLVREVLVGGAGSESGGWYSARPPMPPAAGGQPRIILVTGSDARKLEDLVAHEVGHFWTMPGPEAAATVEERQQAARTANYALTESPRLAGRLASHIAAGEQQADAFASLVLGRMVTQYPDYLRHGREQLELEASASKEDP